MHFPHGDEHILPDKIKFTSPPEISSYDDVDRFLGSLLGLAVGDALGASMEFRPHQYLVDRPVSDMEGGGTWGLQAGQWTDDTSMALCLAASLISKRGYDPYDQMVRYKWWYQDGYLSSTGKCFDIGNATRDSLEEFMFRQKSLINIFHCREKQLDTLSWDEIQSRSSFDINCSSNGVAGNGALMRLAPLPLFFHRHPTLAVEYAGRSARLTHGDRKAVDACRYYAALIVAAVRGQSKKDLLDENFYESHLDWFGSVELHPEILRVARGSYKNAKGYDGGIRGKGYIVYALEAALWAFWSDENSFEKGALAAVNLGDDTDTTAAIYGQLAGAYYRSKGIPPRWLNCVYARNLLECIGQWLCVRGRQYNPTEKEREIIPSEESIIKTLPIQIQSNNNSPSTYNADLKSTKVFSTETRLMPRLRSDNIELAINESEHGRARTHQQGNEYNSSDRLNTNQRSTYPQNNGGQNVHYQDAYQPSTNFSGGFQSLRHQAQPTYGLDWNRTRVDYRGSSSYDSNAYHPSVYNSNVSQSTIIIKPQRDSGDRSITRTSNKYGTVRTLHPGDVHRYSHSSNSNEVIPSRNNNLSKYESHGTPIIDQKSYSPSRSSSHYDDSNPTAQITFSNGYPQTPFNSTRPSGSNQNRMVFYYDGKAYHY